MSNHQSYKNWIQYILFLIGKLIKDVRFHLYYSLCRHGVFQLLSGWADGPEYVTQCPIPPNQSYTYRFNITRQEGTLWWHAHVQWLRATVYGALVIRPRSGRSYPFPKPHREFPILLGEKLIFLFINIKIKSEYNI